MRIIGGGLAGAEAAWQLARRGVAVELFEMRPQQHDRSPRRRRSRRAGVQQLAPFRFTVGPGGIAQGGNAPVSIPWSFAAPMRNRVPAGSALAVDRDRILAAALTEAVEQLAGVRIVREEVRDIPTMASSSSPPGRSLRRHLSKATGGSLGRRASLFLRRDFADRHR